MIGANGHRYWSLPRMVFIFVDSLLIIAGVILGVYLRYWWEESYVLNLEYLALKVMVVVLVVQVTFYYFDLHDLRLFHERKKMGLLLMGALLVSSALLAVVYYTIPLLQLGRGVLIISFSLILFLCFSWRQVYARLSEARALRERVLIIGTGDLAMRIKKEITENGGHGFEIVGFIDENGKTSGKRVRERA